MPKISIDKLESGMRLAKSVLNENGMILLSEGTELTNAAIEKLKNIDVDGVYIKGMSKPDKPFDVALAELNEKFGHVEGEQYMDMLKRVMKGHIEGLYEKA